MLISIEALKINFLAFVLSEIYNCKILGFGGIFSLFSTCTIQFGLPTDFGQIISCLAQVRVTVFFHKKFTDFIDCK